MGGQKNIHRVWLLFLLTVAPIAAPRATPIAALRATPVREMTLRLPFERYHGLIFLKARVNGSEPLSFIFDTGATITVINEPRATALGLTPRDRQLIAGADGGEGTMSFAFARDVAIDLGDERFAPDQVGVTSLALAEKLFGHPMDGILGGDFISRYVVEIDYAGKTLTLYEPKAKLAGRVSAAGETLPLRMTNGYPCVSARLKLPGREALDLIFAIDTGGGGSLALNSPLVTRRKLIESMPLVVPGFSAGLSGETRTVVGRAESLKLGRVAILNPIVGFSQAMRGAHARAEIDGIIGAEIWRRFRVTLDYSRKQMRLEPNDRLHDPFESNMSGLLLIADGADFKTLRVSQVRSDSPAAAAGLHVGDVLLAVDDQPASMFTLFQLEQIFKQDGREVLLRVRRGEEQLQFRFRLKRRI
jgi:predicted aspartyl protease